MVSTDDKKVDVFISISESCWQEYNSRRSYEWKVSFGLWTALGIIAGFSIKEDFVVPFNDYVLLTFLFLIFIAYGWFQYGLNKSNTQDQDKRHYYINNHILPLVGLNINSLPASERNLFVSRPLAAEGPFYKKWSHGSQMLITLAFLLLLGLILINKDQKKSLPNDGCCFKPNKMECLK